MTNPPTYDTRAAYDARHIPGAYYVWTSALFQIRSDGSIYVPGLVPGGARMDQFAQNDGIDKNTTVVFTRGTLIQT